MYICKNHQILLLLQIYFFNEQILILNMTFSINTLILIKIFANIVIHKQPKIKNYICKNKANRFFQTFMMHP